MINGIISIMKPFSVTLRPAAPLSPDRRTLQRWPGLPRTSRSHSTSFVFKFDYIFPFNVQMGFNINFHYFSDNECGLQWVRFSLGRGLRWPWIPQSYLSGISYFRYFRYFSAHFYLILKFHNERQERRGSDTEHSNLDHQSSSSMESNLEVETSFNILLPDGE